MIKTYNTEKYNFHDIVSKVFEINDLSKIHELRKDLHPNNKLNFDNESKTKFHQHFYKNLHDGNLLELEKSYMSFIANEIKPLFSESILFQYMPSFRVHLPGDQAIHKWHYDADDDHRHPEWEINFFIPLTSSLDTQTIWFESIPGLRDFSPANMSYGQYLIFYGNKCTHGNKVNMTDSARVSFDFRIIPSSRFKNNQKTSATTNIKFTEGQYYRRM